MMRTLMTVVVGAALAALPAPARADDSGGRVPRGAGYGVLGLGTPVGFLGLEGAYRIVRDLEITAGAGVGLSTVDGAANALQWAVMPRYRVGGDRRALTVGLGLSGGNYSHSYVSLCGSEEELLECNQPEGWRYTLWANAEIGGEYWAASRFALRYFGGFGHVLAQGAQQCGASPLGCSAASNLPYTTIPYFGIALGSWF